MPFLFGCGSGQSPPANRRDITKFLDTMMIRAVINEWNEASPGKKIHSLYVVDLLSDANPEDRVIDAFTNRE